MKQNLFFVLIAIAILYLMYSFSKNNHKLTSNLNNKKNKHTTKEHFQVDYGLIGEVGSDILSDPIDITDSPDYWERLNAQLETDNSNLSASNQAIRYELDRIGQLISAISRSNDNLSSLIRGLIKENSDLETYIRTTTRCQIGIPGDTQPYGISNCDDIFDSQVMERYKDSLGERLETLETRVNGLLVQDSYDELDLGDDGVTGLTAEQIGEIITHVQNVKTMYQAFFSSLTYNVEDPNTIEWAARTSNIMATAESNCRNKDDTCIYAKSNSDGEVEKYYTSNMNHVFHSDLWPSEESCKADPEGNCHSHGELSSSNCDGREKTCYDLISDPDVNYDHPNNSNEFGQISYNSASYRYTSVPLPNVEGQWSCELNYPSLQSREQNPVCQTESNVRDEARNNCEDGVAESSWGVASYACYTNTATNEVGGYATYSGSEELPSVSYSGITGSSSKVWSNTSNDDDSFGTCTVDNTCRTVAETSNMAACLTQANSNDYTMNYKCYGTSGSNTGIQSQSNGNYRKQYQVGSFDYTSNVWTTGTCSNAYSNYTDCRTKADVDAEVAWKNTGNWQCYTYSNGEVNALEQWNKNYEVNNDFPTMSNKGIGTSTTSDFCRKQEDAEAQSNCLNSNQYSCWDEQESNLDSNIIMQFSKQDTKYKNYTEVPSTSNAVYAGMSRDDFDQNYCTSNDDCTNSNEALTDITSFCEADNIRSTCYKEGTASSNPFGDEVSWSIVYDSNQQFGQYSTRVINGPSNIKCEERENCDTQSNVCESKSNKCYTPQPTYSPDSNTNFFDMTSPSNFNYQSSMLDSTSSNCIADSECVTLPYCSYMAVETNDSNNFVWSNIGQNDCSEPGEGKRYRWTLETNSVAAVTTPRDYTSTDVDTNSNHWRPVNTPEYTSSNSNCTPVDGMVGNAVETIRTEGESDILCQCDSTETDHYALRYYAGSFDSNSPSNIGYSSLGDLQSSNCESNECRARNYYTANERLVECTHPDGLASNAQGEPGLGDKYLDINLVDNGLLCYNDNACSNLCLVSGPSTTSTTQIGDGLYNDEAESLSYPPQCYTHGSSNLQNRFSYAANGSLLTNMPTCTDLVGSNCSSNLNQNCGQQYESMNDITTTNWGTAEYIAGTTNSNSKYTDTYEGNVVRFSGTDGVTISNNVVTYNSSCPSLEASDTDVTKKGLFKYVYTDTYNGDGICIPETTTYVKYQVENIDPSVTDQYGEHSNCPMNCVVTQTWGNWNNDGGEDTVPTIPACAASNTYTRTRRLQSSRYGGAQCVATSDSGQNSFSFNVVDNGNGGDIIETQTYTVLDNDARLKDCCSSNGDGHFTSSPTYRYQKSPVNSVATMGTISPDNEATYSNLYETNNIPCNTKITKTTTTTYTPNSNVCSGGQAQYSTDTSDTRSNSTPCDVDCVLSGWTENGTCPTQCDYTGGNKVYTTRITTQKAGGGKTCQQVAEASKPNGLTTANNYSILSDNTVTATYNNGCPSNLPCCDASKPSHYTERISYDDGTEAEFNNVHLAACDTGKTIKKIINYDKNLDVCKDGESKAPIVSASKNTLRCCTEDDYWWTACSPTNYPACGGGTRYRRDKKWRQHTRTDEYGCKILPWTYLSVTPDGYRYTSPGNPTQTCPISTWEPVFYNSITDMNSKQNAVGTGSVEEIDCSKVTGRSVYGQTECSATGQTRLGGGESVTTFCCKPYNIERVFEVSYKTSPTGRVRRVDNLIIALTDWMAMEDNHIFIDYQLSGHCSTEWEGDRLTLTKKQWNDGDIPYVYERCVYQDMWNEKISEGNRFISIYSFFRFRRGDSYCYPERYSNGIITNSQDSYGASRELLEHYLQERGLLSDHYTTKTSRDMVWS